MYRLTSIILLSALFLASCAKKSSLQSPDFNFSASDPSAIALAKEVVAASGGEKAWHNTRHIRWNFFGSRKHNWDKQTGDVVIESLKTPVKIEMNIHDKTGRVWLDGQETMQADSLSKYLKSGYGWWVNDSYWLILPFKLLDSGVTLKYLGEKETLDGEAAEVLSLNFESVGLTPQNKYHVYIDKGSKRLTQWDFYTNATDPEPRFQLPWKDYRKYGDIWLSGDRGKYALTEISVE